MRRGWVARLGNRLYVVSAALLLLALIPARVPQAGEIRIARVGEPFVYVLEGTPGTGAEWRFSAEDSRNPQLIAVEALGYGEPSNNLIGGPAPFSFELTPVNPGAARLVFVYGRSWEAEPFTTSTLRVYVRAR